MSSSDDDPLGPDYWDAFERRNDRVETARNTRNAAYGGIDPTCWGYRHQAPAEVPAAPEPAEDRSHGGG